MNAQTNINLLQLQNTLESVIQQKGTTDFFPLSESEAQRYKQQYGEFDYIIGNFVIKRLNAESDLSFYEGSK